MDKPSGTGLRKRQQIVKANQLMFLWIIGVSAVVGFSIVLIVFLAQRIWFGERIIAEKENTVSILKKNLEVVPGLQDNVRLLNTNKDLQTARSDPNDSALQVVLDALPADANSTAMASSLQTKLLAGVSGVTIESLRVEPVSGIEIDSDDTTSSGSSNAESGEINFSFTISTEVSQRDSLRKVLQQIERSIRPFSIATLNIESQGNRIVLSATGYGYYVPAQTVELVEKAVRP